MLNITVKTLLVFVAAILGGQVVHGDVNDLAAESLAVYKRLEEKKTLKKQATREQTKRISEIESRLKELRPEIVEKYKSRIQQYTNEIEQLKKKIADLQNKIDEFTKADSEQKKAEEKRLETEISGLVSKKNELAKPFDDQIKDIERIASEKNTAYDEAMKKYCLIPGEQYPEVKSTNSSATLGGTIFSYRWIDASGGRVAWSHLRLRDKPAISTGAKMLDDTYYITSHSDNSIWVWAGHFQICFVMSKQEWQEKEKVAEAVKLFLDMKGLAAIDAAPKAKKEAEEN